MATFTSSSVSNNCVSRELSIASSFVKQYYTLLNKAPCFIYNFYSHNSTFIHGTTDMANEQYTKPIIGRDKIKKKMEDMKLNDCRAKIKQIDCLETLAGGFVIQVIGELSDNGKPMRRFLQTFVLAPSPDESRQEADSQQVKTSNSDRRGVQLNENSSNQATNQKFFVLNSIFRYQDDGTIYNEVENDNADVDVDASTGGTNVGNNEIPSKREMTPPKQAPVSNLHIANSNGSAQSPSDHPHAPRRRLQPEVTKREFDPDAVTERLADDLDEGLKLNQAASDNTEQIKHDTMSGPKGVPNGMSTITDKKSDLSEKVNENCKSVPEQSSATVASNVGGHNPPASTLSRPQPSNEPKTWANMVRNAHTQSSSPATSMHANKPSVAEQQQNSVHLPGATQTAQQQQSQQQSHNQQQNQDGTSINQNNNNRRRMMRKPARSIKNRTRKPMA